MAFSSPFLPLSPARCQLMSLGRRRGPRPSPRSPWLPAIPFPPVLYIATTANAGERERRPGSTFSGFLSITRIQAPPEQVRPPIRTVSGDTGASLDPLPSPASVPSAWDTHSPVCSWKIHPSEVVARPPVSPQAVVLAEPLLLCCPVGWRLPPCPPSG